MHNLKQNLQPCDQGSLNRDNGLVNEYYVPADGTNTNIYCMDCNRSFFDQASYDKHVCNVDSIFDHQNSGVMGNKSNWLDSKCLTQEELRPPTYCGSCKQPYVLICKRCSKKHYESRKIVTRLKFKTIKDNCNRSVKSIKKKQAFDSEIELRFSKERKMIQNKILKLHKESPNSNWYLMVEGKPMQDINEAIRQKLMYGFTVQFRVGLPGGMRRQIDVRLSNGNLYIPGGLVVQNFRNRELYSREMRNHNQNMVRNNLQRFANQHMRQHNEQQPDVQRIVDHNLQYCAKVPLRENDPDWMECKTSTLFEDQLQYARYILKKNDVPVYALNPLVYNTNPQDAIPMHINILCKHHHQVSNHYIPIPMDYCDKYNYSYRIIEGALVIAYPFQGTYHKVTYPNNMVQGSASYYIFNHYYLNPLIQNQNTWVEPHVMVKSKIGDISVPQYVIEWAVKWFGGKNLSGYIVTMYMNDFIKFFNESSNSVFVKPTTEQILSALFHAARLKHMNLQDQLGISYDVLNVQAENVRRLADLPKQTTIYSILKYIANIFIPNDFRMLASEFIDNWKYTGFSISLQPLKEVFESGVAFLFPFFANLVPLKAFPGLSDFLSCVIEELIKTLPLGGIAITIIEIYQDYKENRLDAFVAFQRIFFHAVFDLGTITFKLITLVPRIVIHHGWNMMIKKSKKAVRSYGAELSKDYDRKPEPYVDFMIIPRETKQLRFPESEPVMIPEIILNNHKEMLELLDDKEESDGNPVYVVANPICSNIAGEKNGNNYMNAYLKRNIQERPKLRLTKEIQVAYFSTAQRWNKNLEFHEIDTQKWINQPNHGSKRVLYQKAYDKFIETGDINFGAQLNLKLDEIVFKKSMRTICAFDNSYLVNVAPAIAEYSNALKIFFNGFNNVALPTEGFTLNVLYATGMTTKTMAEIMHLNFIQSLNNQKPHFLLAVLGDDTALIKGDDVLCCDFSRYDSTQHPSQHHAFRTMMKSKFNENAITLLEMSSNSGVSMINPKSGRKYKNVPTVGLKTGCPETSVSNTSVTTLAVYLALKHCSKYQVDWKHEIAKHLEHESGFIPKANMQKISTGFEMLKNIFVLQDEGIVVVPLLSSLAKLGKALKEPRLIVPLAWAKSKHQISVDYMYMQMKGKGNLQKVPGFSKWFRRMQDWSTTSAVISNLNAAEFDTDIVDHNTFEKVYYARYGLEYHDVMMLFDNLTSIPFEMYPFNYISSVVNRAVEVDYGIEL